MGRLWAVGGGPEVKIKNDAETEREKPLNLREKEMQWIIRTLPTCISLQRYRITKNDQICSHSRPSVTWMGAPRVG